MNWALFSQLLVTATVAFTGAFLAHVLSAKRDRTNARRVRRTEFLIDAYRKLESIANRSHVVDTAPVESAISDIQLFGSPEQVQLAQSFATEFAAARTASLDILLRALRKDLRAELELERVPDRTVFFRWIPGHESEEKEAPKQSLQPTAPSRRV